MREFARCAWYVLMEPCLSVRAGTELLAPLRMVFDVPPLDGVARQTILLTDGEASERSGGSAL